jgi:hypothetical protein
MPHLDAQEIKGGLDLVTDGLGEVEVSIGYIGSEGPREHYGKNYTGRNQDAGGDGEQSDKPSL